MKRIPIILLAIICPQWMVAQAPVRRVPTIPGMARQAPAPAKQPRPRYKPASVPATVAAGTEGVGENVTLRVSGNFQGVMPLDFELTGAGPVFATDLIAKNEDPKMPANVVSFEATVGKAKDAGFQVDYSLGARIAIKTSGFKRPDGSESYNLEFRDVVLRGTVLLRNGVPMTIIKLNGKELKIGVQGE